jgi:hypothetical protein
MCVRFTFLFNLVYFNTYYNLYLNDYFIYVWYVVFSKTITFFQNCAKIKNRDKGLGTSLYTQL